MCSRLCNVFWTLLSAILYVVDVFSDVALAIQYFGDGNVAWGRWTTAFIVIPWILTLAFICCSCCQNGWNRSEPPYMFVAAVMNLFPVLLLVTAALQHWRDDTQTAKDSKSLADIFRVIEVSFEALPQSVLQIYIAGQTNHLDLLLIVSIASSLFSISSGYFHCFGAFQNPRHEVPKLFYQYPPTLTFTLIFGPWTFLHVISFIPAVALVSSLKNHSSPWYLALTIYFFLHLPLSLLISVLHRKYSSRHIYGFLLQVVFTFIVIWVATAWLVSLAPFLDSSSLENIPSFVWFDPPPAMRKWILKSNSTTFNETWARCNVTTATPVSMTTNETAAADNITTAIVAVTGVYHSALSWDWELCLTDIAAELYLFFVAASLFLFVYTLIVIHIVLPRIWWKMWKREYKERERLDKMQEEKRNQVDNADVDEATTKQEHGKHENDVTVIHDDNNKEEDCVIVVERDNNLNDDGSVGVVEQERINNDYHHDDESQYNNENNKGIVIFIYMYAYRFFSPRSPSEAYR